MKSKKEKMLEGILTDVADAAYSSSRVRLIDIMRHGSNKEDLEEALMAFEKAIQARHGAWEYWESGLTEAIEPECACNKVDDLINKNDLRGDK